MMGEDKAAAAAFAKGKAPMLFRPSTSTAGIPSSSHNLRSLVDIFGLGPLSYANVASIRNNDRETFISIHNRALEKVSRIAAGEYFCMPDRIDEFHGAQTQYKNLGRRCDLVVVPLNDLAVGKPNELRVLYGELCVDPFMFGRIYTVFKEADTDNGIALSIFAPDVLSTDQSYAKNAYPKGIKIALKQPRLVEALDGFRWLDVNNPVCIVKIDIFPENNPTKFQDWFDNGRRAHDADEWEACVRNYSKCEIILSRTESRFLDSNRMSLRFRLHSDRSRAYIELGRFSDALQDAMTCCEICSSMEVLTDEMVMQGKREMMVQGMRLRIESLISLGRYKETYWFLNAMLAFDSSEASKSLLHFYRQKCIEYYRVGEAIAGIAKSRNYCKPDADFIGPVEIKKSGNGHHRGLFATEFVKSGTVLLVCRALARCDNYSFPVMNSPMANGLVRNVRNAINQERDHLIVLFLSFDPSPGNVFKGYHATLPDFVFDYPESSSNSPSKFVREQYLKLGTEGIRRIINEIAFDEMSPENGNNWLIPSQNRRYYGIWLIPSLINHSCLPNASRIHVGDVMSIHASKDINKGEEITIPYFNVLLPYYFRQVACRTRGFSCVCERCQVETKAFYHNVPRRIYEKFNSAYWKSGLSKTSLHSVKSNIDVEGMSKISEELDGWLESPEEMLGEVDSMWIRSSFILLYLARLRQNLDECDRLKYEENAYRKYLNNLSIVKEALVATCPGDIRHLLLDCRDMAAYRQLAASHPEYEGFHERILKLNKSCDSVYGCQKPKIVKAILRKFSNSSILGE